MLSDESLRGLLDELSAATCQETQMALLRRWIAALSRWMQIE